MSPENGEREKERERERKKEESCMFLRKRRLGRLLDEMSDFSHCRSYRLHNNGNNCESAQISRFPERKVI
jgi:tRNA pseudouridine-54 N-methylase